MAAVTGWDMTIDDMLRIGERRVNLLRLFNAREGVGREADTLPERLFMQPLVGGPSDGYTVPREEWQAAVNLYYEMAGWDQQTGYPTAARLEALGIA